MLTDADGLAHMGADVTVPVLVRPDPRSVLGGLAATVYGNPSQHLRVIGVTGTSGKTTTTYLVEAGLRAADRVAGLIGTVGIRIAGEDLPSTLTTPEAPDLQALLALMVEQGVDTVVMEVSSHALSLGRVDGVEFAVGGFTNLSRDHLDFHPTMEDYFDTKARLFAPGSPTHAAASVVCVDDDAGRAMAALAPDPVTVSATGATPTGASRTSARSSAARRSSSPSIPPACTTGCASGCPAATTSRTACSRRRCWTRSGCHPNRPRQGCGMRGCRAGWSPSTAARTSLRWSTTRTSPGRCAPCWRRCASRPTGRVAVVFGAGGNRDPGKREPMGRVAAELADLVVVTDDNPRDEEPAAIRSAIVAGAAGGPAQVVEIGDRREAIDHAVAWARAGDVVLIAGKGHEAGQTSHGQTRPFDDRDELAGSPRGAGIPRMIDLTLAQIADIVGGELADISAADAAATRVTGTVEFDSRAVTPGGLFLALPGARSDGHDFAAAAVAAGAVGVLAARPVGVPAIVVKPRTDAGTDTAAGVLEHDTDGSGAAVLAALARLAAAVAAELVAGGLTIVGITGSSGKTSTKDLVAAVLAPLGEVVAPPGSFNNELGTPWTVLRAEEDTDYLVLEMSARHPGNIAALAAIAPPSIAVVLNVGTAHLGEFGSREAIARTKAELPQAVPPSGVVILNADDDAVAAMADQTAARVVRVSRSPGADVWAGPVTLDEVARPRFTMHAAGRRDRRSRWRCTATTRCPMRCARPRSRWSAERRGAQVAAALAGAGPVSQAPHARQHPRRRRHRHRRRLQRQPGFHAGRPEVAGLDGPSGRRSPAQLGGARRDGRARRRRDIGA